MCDADLSHVNHGTLQCFRSSCNSFMQFCFLHWTISQTFDHFDVPDNSVCQDEGFCGRLTELVVAPIGADTQQGCETNQRIVQSNKIKPNSSKEVTSKVREDNGRLTTIDQ